ncbi:unnamed protein product [Penicillium salamii]|nr:unnamed protein product [Penicillium salamii]CAG8168799.1 unnamed protein product [Penicillium salamii]CAG8247388.1 unnamed protein product [Penicillium salamii]
MFFNRVIPRANSAVNHFLRPSRIIFPKNMTTTSQRKKREFLCILPDNSGVLELRKKVKSGHYSGIQPLIAQGSLVDGGAIFEQHPQEGEDAKFLGSVVVYTGEDVDEVRRMINNDIYATSGVWDLEKIKIYPVSYFLPKFDFQSLTIEFSGVVCPCCQTTNSGSLSFLSTRGKSCTQRSELNGNFFG